MKKRLIKVLVFLSFAACITLNNISLPPNKEADRRLLILAHRGAAQTFNIENVKWDTNTAAIIHKPEHEYLENTIKSMRAAFSLGADIVEFDVRLTSDNKLAVYHDYLIDYKTEGKGLVSEYTLEELQKLDIGYGYTYDGGKTYPFRSKGKGLMPTFEQVAEEFPKNQFLVHIKDGGPLIGEILLDRFNQMSEQQRTLFSIYGNNQAINLITAAFPEIKSFSRKTLKRGILHYLLIGWSGYVPASIKNTEVHIPLKYAKFLWGWPEKFVERMKEADSRVVLVTMKGPWTGGFDTIEDIEKIPENYTGYISTDRIDRIGPFLK